MDYKEILINNPITFRSVDQIIEDINTCSSTFLIINFGAHNFESIEVIKELKERLNLERDALSCFKRIAILHPQKFKNTSEDENKYRYFCNKKEAVDWLTSVRWFIDCGNDDFLCEGNSLVNIALKKKKVNQEIRIRDGRHSWIYWRESLPNVLEFISDAFHQY